MHEYLNTFTHISSEEFARIAQIFEMRSFPKRHKLVDMGEIEDYFNFIIKGLARKYLIAGKKEVTKQLALEGDSIFSGNSFIYRVPSRMIVETIEPCTVISVKYIDVEQLYLDLPITERLGRLVFTDMFIKQDHQEMNNLEKSTRERFLEYVQTYPHMLQRVPQKYIASFLNIKPETFSRLKHLLKQKTSVSEETD